MTTTQSRNQGVSTVTTVEGEKISTNVPKSELRDPKRLNNNLSASLNADSRMLAKAIDALNQEAIARKQPEVNVVRHYEMSTGQTKAGMHADAAMQSKELIITLSEMVGFKVPAKIANGTPETLIGKKPGQNGGTFDQSELEKMYKGTALLSKTIYEQALKGDPDFEKKYDKKIFFAELEKQGFKPGDHKGSCNDQLNGENQKLIQIIRALIRSRIPTPPTSVTTAKPVLPTLDESPIQVPTVGKLEGASVGVQAAGSNIISQEPLSRPVPNRNSGSKTYGGPNGVAGAATRCLEGCFN
jgi:hypothetical protein